MSAGFKEYLAQEDPKRPYTDQQLAQFLGLRREQVVQLRREAGFRTPGPASGPCCCGIWRRCCGQSPVSPTGP